MTTSTAPRRPGCRAPSTGAGERRRGRLPITLGVVLVSAVGGLDYLTGAEVSVSLLYVLAVMAVTWVGCRRHAILVALLAAAEGLAAQAVHGTAVALTLPIIWNALTDLVVLVLVAVLLDSLHRAVEHQRHLAAVDSLTGVLNRRAFEIAAERERLRAARHGTTLSLAYLDVDHFKAANDRLGHHAGDRVLAAVARAITGAVRGTDLLARVGGDEFVLLLPETDAREAMNVVQRVRAAAASGARAAGYPAALSAGIATFRYPPESVDAMLAAADDLLYKAKQAGRDRVIGAVASGPWPRWAAASLLPDPRALHSDPRVLTPSAGPR
ncbi:MAG: GGDEF domain-containing protein [Actinobacteria bacterium]|nr:GGDEF domain-containing protein [Actinomycetota bacterium]